MNLHQFRFVQEAARRGTFSAPRGTLRTPTVRGACSNPPGTDGFLGLMT